ncbi:MAG: GNAT family N-acetyltransferase [Erysipelotrichaceae bacterium]|jgi:ribosomal-protein-alanine N-acetyltransferase
MEKIETERLLLRPWQKEDVPACYELAKDPDVGPNCGWLPHKDQDETEMIVETALMVPETYAVVRQEDGALIGNIALGKMNGTHAEIGCWLGKPFWGHGYIEEAAEVLIRHGVLELGCETFTWNYYDGNRRSMRAAEKLGFHEDGTFIQKNVFLQKELLVHRMVREIDWKQKTAWIEENASFSQQYQGYYGESDGTHTFDLLDDEEK